MEEKRMLLLQLEKFSESSNLEDGEEDAILTSI
jgi:hypothetical protein